MFKYIFISLILSLNIFANDISSVCNNNLDNLPVLAQGRVKTYFVLAKETIKKLTGKTSVNDLKANQIFCLKSLGIANDVDFKTPVEHVEVKRFLSLSPKDKTISLETVAQKKDLIRSEILKIKEETSYKKALNRLYNKINLYLSFKSGTLWTYHKVVDGKKQWITIHHLKDKSSGEISSSLTESKKSYDNLGETAYLLENKLHKMHVFSIAMLVAILGIAVSVLFRNLLYGQIFAVLTLLIEVLGITLRVLISGRAPITNMYETVLFSGFGALFIALIITLFKKDRLFILGGLGYNILCLFMMKFAGSMLDESISPLVPVLRDNFWLSTHVTTIMLSYAALALSWMLANFTLVKGRWGSINRKDYKYYEDLIYTCIKVGIILLSAGIILGGVWADYSWGRFWGWDPKETWSLIVLLFYMAMLHGKNTTWMNTHRFVGLAATGFLTVMMAWFGVNYILASGLHSYGFSEGGAIFLGSFFAVQIVILALTTFKNPLISK